MSSVLYPVGPQPPRVYWVRRLVVLGVPLILILIIAISCSGGGGAGKPSRGTGANATPTASTTPEDTSNPNAACAPTDLSASVVASADDGIYEVGESPTFTATIRNVSLRTCKFTSTPANEIWKVTSGAAQWWSTAAPCSRTGPAKTKRLAPQASQQISFTWDGTRQDPGCDSGDAAQPGTYVLHAKLDGVKAQKVVLHFRSNTEQ
jgi:hypothetical protein